MNKEEQLVATTYKERFVAEKRLHPCPFCGMTARYSPAHLPERECRGLLIMHVDFDRKFGVSCQECGTSIVADKPIDNVIALWNKRVTNGKNS